MDIVRRLCVRTFTNTIIRLRNVWHNAELIGSHVSAAMNSYVGVTCLAQRVSEEYGIAKSQTRYAAVFPSTTLLFQKHRVILYTLVSRPKSFRRCSFRKTRYSVVYRDVNSVFFIFTRSLVKYKFNELNKIYLDSFFLKEFVIQLHYDDLNQSLSINLLYTIVLPKGHPFAKQSAKEENENEKNEMNSNFL